MASKPRPRATPWQREQAAGRAISRREAREQTREALASVPKCPHGWPRTICPACQRTPLEEVPF